MLGIKRILCPTDFSQFSHRALAHAITLSKWTGARITVLYAVPVVFAPPLAVPAPTPAIPLAPETRARLESDLVSFAAAAERAQVPVDTKLVEGDPVTEILAASASADVVVMGTHGARGFERFVLGSVTERVLRKAACPVMTIPRREPDGGESDFLFQTILCPVDFSDCSSGALRAACEIAKETKGRLVILHVVDWIGDEIPGASLLEAAYERLDALVPFDAPPARQLVRGGRSFREILRAAEETGAGLVVMGVQGRGAIDLMLFGSTSHHVIREARCPVLTVRAPGAAPREARASETLHAPA